MTVTKKVYYHWVVTLEGKKFYLGYDYHLGYEHLYGKENRYLASRFYSDKPFDISAWIDPNRIVNSGVEEVI